MVTNAQVFIQGVYCDARVSSFDVQPTRGDGWDRGASVLGFWGLEGLIGVWSRCQPSRDLIPTAAMAVLWLRSSHCVSA